MAKKKFKVGDLVRWRAHARECILAGHWNERNYCPPNIRAMYEAEVVCIRRVVEVNPPDSLVLDIPDDHPFFSNPNVGPAQVEPLSALEQLAAAARD